MPTRGYLWNLSEWMERFGFNRDDAPDIAWGVQPTISLGDASALTTPILPPLAWFGSTRLFTPRVFAFTIRSIAPGGTFIRDISVSPNSSVDFTWDFSATPAVLSDEEILTARNMGPDPVSAVVRMGTQTPSTQNDIPVGRAPTGLPLRLIDEIYLPPGIELLMKATLVNITVRAAALVQDVPAMIPSAAPPDG